MSRPQVLRLNAAVLLTPAAARVLVDLVRRYEQVIAAKGARLTAPYAALLAQLEEAAADGGPDAGARTPVAAAPWLPLSSHDLVDTVEAAAVLGCTPSNVRDLARRGALPAHRTGGRWLLERDGVELRRGPAA